MRKKFLKSSLSVIMAMVMIICSALPAFAVSVDEIADYEGEVLVAVNTNDANDSGKQGFTASVVKQSSKNVANEQNESSEVSDADASSLEKIDADLPEVVPLKPEEVPSNSAPVPSKATKYKTNDEKTIFSDEHTNNANNEVNLTCMYVGKYCTVWCQNDCDDEIELSKSQAKEIGKQFDSYKAEIDKFIGDVKIDADNDGKIAIFCYDLNNEYAEPGRMGDGYIGGYFWGCDLVDSNSHIGDVVFDSSNYNGNNIDAIHIDTYPAMGSSGKELKNIGNIYSTLVHEYQHFVNFSYSFKGKNNDTYLNPSEIYIDEAFSMATEHVICGSSTTADRIDTFNYRVVNEQGVSLTYWDDNAGADNYGLPYVFGQYIRTRYAQLTSDKSGSAPGNKIYKKVLESRNQTNDEDTLGIIADLLYPTNKYDFLKSTDARKEQLLKDFWIAVYVLEDKGIYGFNGESFAESINIQAATNNALPSTDLNDIGNAGVKYYYINGGRSGEAHIDTCGEDMRFAAINTSVETHDIVLLLDYSSSMKADQISKMKTAAYLFCDQIGGTAGTRIAIVPYATRNAVAQELTNDKNLLCDKINGLSNSYGAYGVGSSTYMAEALNKANSILVTGDADKQVIVLMTDGKPNGNITGTGGRYSSAEMDGVYETAESIIKNSQKDVDIYTLGIYPPDNADYDEAKKLLEDISNIQDNEGTYTAVDDANKLVFEFANISQNISKSSDNILITIDCPVNVTIRRDAPLDVYVDNDGNLVTCEPEILDSTKGNSRASFGTMVAVNGGTASMPDNDISAYLSRNSDYIIEIDGLATGTVDFSAIIDGVTWSASDIEVTEDSVIYGNVEIKTNGEDEEIELEIDKDGDGKIDEKISISPEKEDKGETGGNIFLSILAAPFLFIWTGLVSIFNAISMAFMTLFALIAAPFV